MSEPGTPAAALPPPSAQPPAQVVLTEILPKNGLVYSEKSSMTELLCKPKLLPIKSQTLERLEQLERDAAKASGSNSNNQPSAAGQPGGRLGPQA